jgi:hypothetical protein
MKRAQIYLGIPAIILMMATVTAFSGDDNNYVGDHSVLVARIVDGEVVQVLKDSQLRELFSDTYDLSEDGDGAKLDSVMFSGTQYLVGMGRNIDGGCLTTAKALFTAGNDIYLAEETHTCTGVSCSSCSFVRNAQNKITGCSCGQTTHPGGHCNHTVSGGS